MLKCTVNSDTVCLKKKDNSKHFCGKMHTNEAVLHISKCKLQRHFEDNNRNSTWDSQF